MADRRKVVTPNLRFDPAEADPKRLAEGHSTIKGLTCARVMVVGGSRFRSAPNQSIILFPYTAYVQEAINLIDREQIDSSSDDIIQAEVTVDQDGQTVDDVVVKPKGGGRFLPLLDVVCKARLKD